MRFSLLKNLPPPSPKNHFVRVKSLFCLLKQFPAPPSALTLVQKFLCLDCISQDSVLLKVLQRKRTFIYKMRCIMKNWLMRLWRLRSPTICCRQAGGPGKQVVCIPAPAKGLRSRSVSGVSSMRIRDPCLGSSRWAETPTDAHCLSLETELSEPGTGLGPLHNFWAFVELVGGEG